MDHYITSKLSGNENSAICWLREHLDSVVKDAGANDDELNAEADQWLRWAKSKNDLKIVSVVIPSGILPDGTTGQLSDVKVFSKHGPDDELYDRDEEIRSLVSRGNCILTVSQNGSGDVNTCIIHAMKKFTGGLGDDDDYTSTHDNMWKCYFAQPVEDSRYIVCTKKLNGEAAHLGAFRLNDQIYICAGSKNVHLVFRTSDDLSKYPLHEPRYKFAVEICRCILGMLDGMNESSRNSLLQFLCDSRCNAVFELLSPDHQHVEDLSTLSSSSLIFIAWTSCRLYVKTTSFCLLPPDAGIELARVFGLCTVKYNVIELIDLETHIEDIRCRYGVEGEVLYFLDGNKVTIGLVKKKTIWYIIVRAIREKVLAASRYYYKSHEVDISQFERKLERRMKEIQQWLKLDDACIREWTSLGNNFLRWCISKVKVSDVTIDELSGYYPVHWNNFLTSSGTTDRICCTTSGDML